MNGHRICFAITMSILLHAAWGIPGWAGQTAAPLVSGNLLQESEQNKSETSPTSFSVLNPTDDVFTLDADLDSSENSLRIGNQAVLPDQKGLFNVTAQTSVLNGNGHALVGKSGFQPLLIVRGHGLTLRDLVLRNSVNFGPDALVYLERDKRDLDDFLTDQEVNWIQKPLVTALRKGLRTTVLNRSEKDGRELGRGGGIWARDSDSLLIERVLFENNTADIGGAVWMKDCRFSRFIGSAFNSNASHLPLQERMESAVYLFRSPYASFREVVFNDGGVTLEQSPRASFSDCVFRGGGLLVNDSSETLVGDSLFEGIAKSSAVHAFRSGGLRISGVRFKNNVQRGTEAFIVWLDACADAVLSDVVFENNAGSWGGALKVTRSEALLRGVIFENNSTQAESGSAVHVEGTAANDARLTMSGDCSFFRNTSHKGGGAVWLGQYSTLLLMPGAQERIFFASPSDGIDGAMVDNVYSEQSSPKVVMQGEGVWEMHAGVAVPTTVEKGTLRAVSEAYFHDLSLKPGSTLYVDTSQPLEVGTLNIEQGNVHLVTGPFRAQAVGAEQDFFLRYDEFKAGPDNLGFVTNCPGGKVANDVQARTLRLICPSGQEE